jgi:hypothetical protein
MASLVSVSEFSVWVQREIDPVEDQFAVLVLEQASALVREAAERPDWPAATAPAAAKRIAALCARRTYINPDMEKSSTVGPLSGSLMDDALAWMRLFDEEVLQLQRLGNDGVTPSTGGLWVQPTTRGPVESTRDVLFWDEAGAWPIPYLAAEEAARGGVE